MVISLVFLGLAAVLSRFVTRLSLDYWFDTFLFNTRPFNCTSALFSIISVTVIVKTLYLSSHEHLCWNWLVWKSDGIFCAAAIEKYVWRHWAVICEWQAEETVACCARRDISARFTWAARDAEDGWRGVPLWSRRSRLCLAGQLQWAPERTW